MNTALSYKTKHFFFVLIKLSIVIGAFYFIVKKLQSNPEFNTSIFITFLSKTNLFSFKNVLLLLVLTGFNWFLEFLKWKKLVSTLKKISTTEALKQCLGSLTASIITPNRIGEYGAKALFYQKTFRKKIMLLNLIGNTSLMFITSIFGVIGLFFFIKKHSIHVNYTKLINTSIIVTLLLVLAVFILKKNDALGLNKLIAFFKALPKKILFSTVSFSLLRYITFSFQFYLLLLMFKIDILYFNAMVYITSMYLLASVIPSILIFDVVIKGSIALYLFDFLGVNSIVILSITTIMWLLNFVLPSIFGSYFVLIFKLPNTKS